MQRNKILVCFLIVFLASSFVNLVYAGTFTFGNESGTHSISLYPDEKGACAYTSTGTGIINYLTAYVAGNGAGQVAKLAVYSNNANSPNELLGTSDEEAIPNTALADVDFSFTEEVTVSNGVVYWFAYLAATYHLIGTLNDASQPDILYNSDTYSDGFSDPYGSTSTVADHYMRIHAHCTETGGETATKIQGNFAPTFTFGSTRTWNFQTYRTIPFAFALNHWNSFSFSNLHTFSVSFSTSLNRFVNLNTQNTLGLAFTLNQLRTWQFTSHRTIPFQLALNSIQNFAYTLPGLLTFYGDITATFTMKALKEAGFTTEQTISFTFAVQSATTILQLGVLTIWSSIGFTFQTLSIQGGLAEITLDYAFALAGLAFILAITGITITLVRRKGE